MGIAFLFALVAVEPLAQAQEPSSSTGVAMDEGEVTRSLESRNAARDSADRAKANDQQRNMALRVETAQGKEHELTVADEKLRNAVAVESSRIVRRTLGVWSTAGGGVLALAGIGLYAAALSARSSIEDGSLRTGADIQAAADHTRTYAPVGLTLASVGIVAVGVGVALLLGSKKGDGVLFETRTTGGLHLDPRLGRLTW